MICSLCPVGYLILIFIGMLPLPNISAFQRVIHFSSECYSTVYRKSALDLLWQFFLKMILGRGGGLKKIKGDLPWMIPGCGHRVINKSYNEIFEKVIPFVIPKTWKKWNFTLLGKHYISFHRLFIFSGFIVLQGYAGQRKIKV